MKHWLKTNRFLVVFALLASLMGTSVGVAKIATSLYALALGADATQSGLIANGQVAGTLVTSVPIGFLVAGLVYAAVPQRLVASASIGLPNLGN